MDLVGISTSRGQLLKVFRSIIWKWDLDLDFWFNLDPSVSSLSTDIKFKYQLEEKEIDFVEELELYSLMMSR